MRKISTPHAVDRPPHGRSFGSLFESTTPASLNAALSHTAIRASAGSGKTFQLTNRYLQLVAAGAEPSTILASTFTRLAAGQIRDRILSRLAEAADDQVGCDELAQALQLPGLARAHVKAILARLAKRLHVMQIRTLDSFFAAIVRAFAIELQIPLGAEVIDEEQAAALRDEAIGLMLDEHDPQQLIEMLRLLTQGASDRAITSRIDLTVSQLYELWREAPPQAWECVPTVPGRLPPPRLVSAIKRLEEAACSGSDRWTSAFQKDCENARNWRWSEFLAGGLAKPIASGANTYGRNVIPDELINAYAPVVRHAIAELIERVREQTLATRDLLAAFHQQYEKVKRRHRAVTFADLAGAMIRAQDAGGFDEISFRLDARLAHLLLDEFQDTSITQWNALAPLAWEVTSVAPPDKSFFCVGDVKQSIYRWREAAPEVLDGISNLLPGLEIRTLAKSYRSAPHIMEAVNRVFSSIESNAALADHSQAAAAWAAGFTPHETAKTELPGYVELRFCRRAADDEAADVIRLRSAAELAAQLHQANPQISIAVLTRTNRAVGRLLYELGPSRLNVAGGVSGRGGGPLTDAAPVNVILDLLQLADHPDDTVAAFNVAMAPMDLGSPDRRWWNDCPERQRIARTIRRSLLDDGYGATVSRWVREIAATKACDAREMRRLREFVALADTFDQTPTLRTRGFIRLVEQTRIADIQPAAVQVMTTHQAKGLEFDAVILAELGSKLTGAGTPAIVAERGDGVNDIGPITRVCRYMNKEVIEFVPELLPMFDRHTQRVVRESLSVLYVGMTRAIHGLYMIVNPPDINKNGAVSTRDLKTLAGVLRCALARDDVTPDSAPFKLGDESWHKGVKSRIAGIRDDTTVTTIRLAPSKDNQRGRFSAATAASARAQSSLPLMRQLRLPDVEAIDRGTALHALFEQVEWLEEFAATQRDLVRMVRSRLPRRDDAWAVLQAKAFQQAIAHPVVRQLLSRGGIDGSRVRVHREQPFARLIDGEIQRGSIDRLVVHLTGACAIDSAHIIDFKSDICAEEDIERLGEHYRPQMATYRDAAAEMLGLEPQRVQAHLLFVHGGWMIEA